MTLAVEGPVWLVGAGAMGGALATRWLDAVLASEQLVVIDPGGARVSESVPTLPAPPRDGAVPALLVLAVKPQLLDEVATQLAPLVAPETILISILAGVELAALRGRFPAPRVMVRAMPNTPVALGKGAVALCAEGPVDREALTELMAPLGLVRWIDERHFDAVTALSGSGPALVFRVIDALADGGRQLGLPRDDALKLALATVEGAGALAAASDNDPSILADRVASPGGGTRELLDTVDRDDALKRLISQGLAAAHRRYGELAAAARSSSC